MICTVASTGVNPAMCSGVGSSTVLFLDSVECFSDNSVTAIKSAPAPHGHRFSKLSLVQDSLIRLPFLFLFIFIFVS